MYIISNNPNLFPSKMEIPVIQIQGIETYKYNLSNVIYTEINPYGETASVTNNKLTYTFLIKDIKLIINGKFEK